MDHQLQVSCSCPLPYLSCGVSSRALDPSFLFAQHGAIRTTLSGPADYENDDKSGFQRIEAREIDTLGRASLLISNSEGELKTCEGVAGIVKKIRDTVGDRPVYLSIDIDSIDPA
jgi:agmatinase